MSHKFEPSQRLAVGLASTIFWPSKLGEAASLSELQDIHLGMAMNSNAPQVHRTVARNKIETMDVFHKLQHP